MAFDPFLDKVQTPYGQISTWSGLWPPLQSLFCDILLWNILNSQQNWKKNIVTIHWWTPLNFTMNISNLFYNVSIHPFSHPSIHPFILAWIFPGFGASQSKLQVLAYFSSLFLLFPLFHRQLSILQISHTILNLWALYLLSLLPELSSPLVNFWLIL